MAIIQSGQLVRSVESGISEESFGVRESLYPRNRTFEVTREILIENTEKWSEISLDRESL